MGDRGLWGLMMSECTAPVRVGGREEQNQCVCISIEAKLKSVFPPSRRVCLESAKRECFTRIIASFQRGLTKNVVVQRNKP